MQASQIFPGTASGIDKVIGHDNSPLYTAIFIRTYELLASDIGIPVCVPHETVLWRLKFCFLSGTEV